MLCKVQSFNIDKKRPSYLWLAKFHTRGRTDIRTEWPNETAEIFRNLSASPNESEQNLSMR